MATFDNFDTDIAQQLMASLELATTQEVNKEFKGDTFNFEGLGNFSLGDDLKPKLERVVSRSGRPEEYYQTIKKKNKKGTNLQIGNYQLGEKLGKGAFGVVYKGLDLKTGQFVAVKRLSRAYINGNEMLHEIEFLKKFQHKNIVRYVNLVETDRHLNVVLEFVDSGSLAQVLCGYGYFPESLAAIYVKQVLEGLAYLHSQQIIHRDIKGGNLLITRDGTIKVADFGIATMVSTSASYTTLSEGSPYWMAPEIIEMTHKPTTASDIWSLACTLIELLTGFPPYFEMAAVSAIYKMVNDERPPLPDDISDELTDFFTKCFARDPGNRPTAAELLNHPWIKLYNSTDEELAENDEKAGGKQIKFNTTRVGVRGSVLGVDELGKELKNYTLTKEAGNSIKHYLNSPTKTPMNASASENSSSMKNNLFHARTRTMDEQSLSISINPNSNDPSSQTDIPALISPRYSAGSGSISKKSKRSSKKEKKKLKSGNLTNPLLDADQSFEFPSSEKKRKTTLVGTFMGKKKDKERKKSDSEGIVASSDSELMVVNIYAVENRRNVFTYTIYKIKVMQDARVWDIERTWSDFKELQTKLEQIFPEQTLPPCPSRRFWGVMDSEFVGKRWQDLQHYLVALVSSRDIRDSPPFLHFLTAH